MFSIFYHLKLCKTRNGVNLPTREETTTFDSQYNSPKFFDKNKFKKKKFPYLISCVAVKSSKQGLIHWSKWKEIIYKTNIAKIKNMYCHISKFICITNMKFHDRKNVTSQLAFACFPHNSFSKIFQKIPVLQFGFG